MEIIEIIQVLENLLESVRINLREYRKKKTMTEHTAAILQQLIHESQAIYDAIEILKGIPDSDVLPGQVGRLLEDLRWMTVETGSLICLGCGREYNCGVHGCRILREARTLIARLAFREERERGEAGYGAD